jgi:pilus assembly protein CpaB
MTYRIRNIVVAIALAALAALLTSFYVANYKRTVLSGEEHVTVYVAAQEIPAGTSGEEAVGRGLLRPEEIARRNVVPGAISTPDQVHELVAAETIYDGEQVSVRRFVQLEAAGVRAELKGNVRAFQVPGDANQLLAGTLERGDRVDVVGNFRVRGVDGSSEIPVTRVVLRDIEVLRAPPSGTLTSSEGVGSSVASLSVMLALTDAQAQKLFFTVQNGEWSLQLRPVVEAADSAETLETHNTVLCDGMRPGGFISLCDGRTP